MKTHARPRLPAATRIDACWSRIGVRGDGSCPRLAEHVHCHNCPVHASAAGALLENKSSMHDLAEWAAYYAHDRRGEELGTHSLLIFRVGMEWLALAVAALDAIVDLRPIHSLPHRRSDIVLGLVNVRGELLVAVALGKLLGQPMQSAKPGTGRQRLVIAHHDGLRLAFPVDEVHGTHRYHPQQLKPVPSTVAKATGRYTQAVLAWQERSVGCLDHSLLFYSLSRSLA